jgi:hypothetical protein
MPSCVRSSLIALSFGTAILAMTGCASSRAGQRPFPQLPPNLTAACEDLPQPASGQLPDLLINLKERTELYADCADRHASLVRITTPPPAVPPWWQFWKIWW